MSSIENSLMVPFKQLMNTARDRRLARERLARVERVLRAAWWSARASSERVAWLDAVALARTPAAIFGSVSDERWLWLNSAGYRQEPALRLLLPGIPEEEVQQRFTGSGGDITLREGWNVYRLVKQAYDKYSTSGPLGMASSVLDFGCGWGRIIRFFLKNVDPDNILGIDCDGAALDLCRQTNRWSQFTDVAPMPPAPLPDGHFDLIYAYSVFSHLSEEAHDRWLDEFRRILKPEGLLMVSTRPRSFIEKCAWLRTDEGARAPVSHRVAGGAFPDTVAALAGYDQGAYCFSYRNEHDPPHFGEACIPRRYVEDRWTDRFRLLEYVDDHRLCEQNFVVARRA